MAGRIVKNDFDGLRTFMKTLNDKRTVKVGIFADRASRFEAIKKIRFGSKKRGVSKTAALLSNPDIGAKHEMGSQSEGIPKRSFLRHGIHHEQQKIVRELKAKGAARALARGDKTWILKNLGFLCEAAIDRCFQTKGFGSWPKNAPATIAMKGSASPLIDTGQLRRSITSKVSDAAS